MKFQTQKILPKLWKNIQLWVNPILGAHEGVRTPTFSRYTHQDTHQDTHRARPRFRENIHEITARTEQSPVDITSHHQINIASIFVKNLYLTNVYLCSWLNILLAIIMQRRDAEQELSKPLFPAARPEFISLSLESGVKGQFIIIDVV